MKTIMLMRHAKSSRADMNQKDFERPLAEQGQQDAPNMGWFVRKVDVLPDYIVSSPAKRAQQTSQLFVKSAGIDESAISWKEDLYYGGARDYFSCIQKASNSYNHIMLVGHNPLLEETVSLLCNGEGAYTVRMPTGGLVRIEHPAIKWSQIKPGTARFQWMMIPELLNKLND